MNCAEVFRHICDNLDQSLGTARCREIRLHLKVCSDCRAYLASLKGTVSLYRSVPSPDLPESAHRRLIKALNAHGCFPVTGPRPHRAPSPRRHR